MPAQYPTAVWDGTSETRPDADVYRQPDAADWAQLRAEVTAIQTQLFAFAIPASGVLPTSNPGAGKLWNNTNVVNVGT